MMKHMVFHTRSQRRACAFSLIVGVILFLSLLAAPVAAAKLPTPTLISPANNQHFLFPDGIVFMTWKSVPGSSITYMVEIEYKPKIGGAWTPHPDYPSYLTPRTYMLQSWSPLYVYRWRVTAKDGSSVMDPSTPSTWRTFDFTTEKMQLATPVLIAPPMAANLYNTDYTTVFNWNIVPGAQIYRLEVQVFDPATKAWSTSVDTTTGMMASFMGWGS